MYSSEGWPEKSDIHDTYKDASIGDNKINILIQKACQEGKKVLQA